MTDISDHAVARYVAHCLDRIAQTEDVDEYYNSITEVLDVEDVDEKCHSHK